MRSMEISFLRDILSIVLARLPLLLLFLICASMRACLRMRVVPVSADNLTI